MFPSRLLNSQSGHDQLSQLLFTWVSKTFGPRSGDPIIKSIIDLKPKASWGQVHLWAPLYTNMVIVMDKSRLAQKFNNKALQCFRSESSHAAPGFTVATRVGLEVSQPNNSPLIKINKIIQIKQWMNSRKCYFRLFCFVFLACQLLYYLYSLVLMFEIICKVMIMDLCKSLLVLDISSSCCGTTRRTWPPTQS